MRAGENASTEFLSIAGLPLTLEGKPLCESLDRLLTEARTEVCAVAPGETVFEEGAPADAAYFIRSGSIEILGYGPEGEECLLNRLGRGELFGEMALLDQTLRSATAVSRTGAELYVVPRAKVVELMLEMPEIALWMLKLFSRRLRVLTSTVSQMERVHDVNLKILAGKDQERQRIGRDIHDRLAQHYAAHILRLQAADLLMDRRPEEARKELAALQEELRAGRDTLHELVYNLYPKELSCFGLAGAIGEFADRIAKSDHLSVSVHIQPLPEGLPSALQSMLYCVVQEALNNVNRHAQASNVRLDLTFENGALELRIEDDGRGFEPARAALAEGCYGGYGLISMQDRTKLAGGTMELRSSLGAGTTLRFRIPLTEPE